jgi:transcriptional regulator with XRE-family HTH domain
MHHIARVIEEEAERQGVSVSTLAARAGVSPTHFYRWKRGESAPRPSTVNRISSALGIPVATLLGEALNLEPDSGNTERAENVATKPFHRTLRFVGLTDETVNALMPLLQALEPNVCEVPRDMSSVLQRVARPIRKSLTAGQPMQSTPPNAVQCAALKIH